MAPFSVLVIGGSGLMGAATVRELLRRGHAPTSLTRGRADRGGGRPRTPLPAGLQTLVLDRSSSEGAAELRRLVASGTFDAVVDYCAMAPAHVSEMVEAFKGGGRHLRRYVFISTNMVYPGGPGGYDISPLRPLVAEGQADVAGAESAPDDYGGRKLKCEALLRAAHGEVGFPFVSLRPPSVIGPACDNRHEMLQRVAMGLPPLENPRNRPLASRPEGGFRLAYSEDVARLCADVLEAPDDVVVGEAFNVAMDEAVTLEGYLAACRAAASPEEELASWPAPEQALARLEALGAPLRSYEGQSCLDTAKAQGRLGWRPSTFAEAMKATVDWHTPLLRGSAAAVDAA